MNKTQEINESPKLIFENATILNEAVNLVPASSLTEIDFEEKTLAFKDRLTRDFYFVRLPIDCMRID